MPKFSIILPCYNVEKYLAKSIDSVLAQTYPDFELLVVIDGSPDQSIKIAEKYATKDSRIKVFEKENGGLSDARNYGLERAQGEFIYFMDSDDWIEPDLLKDNLDIMTEENLDFVVFGYIQDDENTEGKVIDSQQKLPQVEEWKKNDPNLEVDQFHLGILGYAWNKVYRKSFLDKHSFRFRKGISLVEDILFNAPIYAVSDKIRFNQKAYYHYLNRPVVTLMKTFHENVLELRKEKNYVLDDFLTAWKVPNKEQILARNFIGSIRGAIHSLFAYKNQLSEQEKRAYLKKMYLDKTTRALIDYYQPKDLKEKLHKHLVKYKMVYPTYIFAKLIK